MTTTARFRLMQLYKVRARYEDAIREGEKIIKSGGMSYALESKVHLEVANCFDFLGDAAPAASHRESADECLDNRPEDTLGWSVQGELYEKQKRFTESADSYVRAFELCPSEDKAAQGELLLQLTVITYHGGRPDETVKWAQRAIDLHVRPALVYLAHRIAGAAASNLALFDESLRHRQKAHEMAIQVGEPKQIADCLASLGALQLVKGDFHGAESLCQQAEILGPDSNREHIAIQALIDHSRGLHEAAARRWERALSVGALPDAFNERRAQAILKIWLAVFKADANRLDEARPDLEDAIAELGDERQMGLLCEAASIRLLAHQGQRDAVLGRTQAIMPKIDSLLPNRSAWWDVLEMLGRALFQIGDHERSRQCWDRFLEIPTQPLGLSTAHYFIGECQWLRGDRTAGLDAFHRATESGIDSHFAHLAERRVLELSSDLQGGT